MEYKIPKGYEVDVLCVKANGKRFLITHKGYEEHKTYYLFEEKTADQWKNVANSASPNDFDKQIWG